MAEIALVKLPPGSCHCTDGSGDGLMRQAISHYPSQRWRSQCMSQYGAPLGQNDLKIGRQKNALGYTLLEPSPEYSGRDRSIQWPLLHWLHSITMTSQWARWRFKSPASRLFAQPFVQAQISTPAPRHWHLWRKSLVTGAFPSQRVTNAENVYIWWRHHVVADSHDVGSAG